MLVDKSEQGSATEYMVHLMKSPTMNHSCSPVVVLLKGGNVCEVE